MRGAPHRSARRQEVYNRMYTLKSPCTSPLEAFLLRGAIFPHRCGENSAQRGAAGNPGQIRHDVGGFQSLHDQEGRNGSGHRVQSRIFKQGIRGEVPGGAGSDYRRPAPKYLHTERGGRPRLPAQTVPTNTTPSKQDEPGKASIA